MPSNFDAEAYAAEVAAMDARTVLTAFGCACGQHEDDAKLRVLFIEILSRLASSDLRAECERLQTQLAACRREALEEAAKAVCFDCRTTQPFPPEVVNGCHVHLPYEKVPGGYCNCNAHPIHQIIEKEANGDSR